MRVGITVLLAVLLIAAPARADSPVTLPHAKKPLSDKRAAKLVKHSRFEPRPANREALRTMPTAAQLRAFRAQSEMPYARYVSGRFTGTTDEVIQWSARKWGFKPDLLRAVATVESWWRMSTVGDNGDSFGLFQVRRPFHCTEPVCEQFRGDAALNADYTAGSGAPTTTASSAGSTPCRARTASAIAAATCGARSARGSRGGGGTSRPAATSARSSGG
jgi:hypothetical protein